MRKKNEQKWRNVLIKKRQKPRDLAAYVKWNLEKHHNMLFSLEPNTSRHLLFCALWHPLQSHPVLALWRHRYEAPCCLTVDGEEAVFAFESCVCCSSKSPLLYWWCCHNEHLPPESLRNMFLQEETYCIIWSMIPHCALWGSRAGKQTQTDEQTWGVITPNMSFVFRALLFKSHCGNHSRKTHGGWVSGVYKCFDLPVGDYLLIQNNGGLKA